MPTNRIAVFSDAVFAISATIKVLPIKLDFPVGDLQHELLENRFPVIMYFASFVVIMIIWENHVLLFDRLDGHDEIVVWMNLMLMMMITFVPYPLTIMGAFETEPDGILFCAVTFMIIGVVQCSMVIYTNRRHVLLSETFKNRRFNSGLKQKYIHWHDFCIANRVGMLPAIFLLAYALATIDYRIAYWFLALIPFVSPFLRWIERKWIGLVPLTRFLSDEVAMDRVVGFCDGVYAITMTFLVLDAFDNDDINTHMARLDRRNATGNPDGGFDRLSDVLLASRQKYFSYFLNFTYLAINWSTSASMLGHINVVDDPMRVILTLRLCVAGLAPFIASILTEYSSSKADVEVAVRLACLTLVVGSACQVLFWAYACSSWASHHVLGARVNQNPELRWYIGTKAVYLPASMSTVGAMTFHWPERSYDIMTCGLIFAMLATIVHSYCFLDPRNDGRIGPPRLKIKLPRIRRRKTSQLNSPGGLQSTVGGSSSESSDDGLIQTDWNQLSGRSSALELELGALRPGPPGWDGTDTGTSAATDAAPDGGRHTEQREQPNGAFGGYEADIPNDNMRDFRSPFMPQASDEALVGAYDAGAGRPSASSISNMFGRVPFNVSSASDITFDLPGDELVRSRQKLK